VKRFAAATPWLAALLGAATAIAVFYPGYLSWDSAYQWWQARHDHFDGSQPPLMAMLWRLTEGFWPGPGGLFVLQIGLIWSALACWAQALDAPPWRRALWVLVLGFWPPLFGLSAHLWKDLWTLIGFAWAVALLTHELRRPSRWLRGLALFALGAACAFRFNALSGALPLLLWLGWREARMQGWAGKWPTLVLTLAFAAVVFGLSILPSRDVRVRAVDDAWSVVTLWDAAAVSLAEGHLIYPPELVESSLSLEQLRSHFLDYSNTTVYETGKLRHSFDAPYSPAQRLALRRLALALPTRHSAAYFRHRLRLAILLFGWDRAGLPDGQVLMPGVVQYGDNPPLARAPSALRDRVMARLLSWVDTPLFAGWIYLLMASALTLIGRVRMRGQGNSSAGLMAAVAASCLSYALPLAVVSGSAEFRYLAWPVLACLFALAMACSGCLSAAARRPKAARG
jgi:hypothetical protein